MRIDRASRNARTPAARAQLAALVQALAVVQAPAGEGALVAEGALGDLVAWEESDPDPDHGEGADNSPEVDPTTGRRRIGFVGRID